MNWKKPGAFSRGSARGALFLLVSAAMAPVFAASPGIAPSAGEIRPILIGSKLLAAPLKTVAGAQEILKRGAAEESGFTLYSDYDMEAARALGIAFHVDDEGVSRLMGFGLDLTGNAVSGGEQALPVPAVFVVRPDGVISFSYVNPDYKVRCDPGIILAAARAIRPAKR